MADRAPPSWPELAVSSWMLMGEASMVVWLRSIRLMMGGPLAEREARRMTGEKVEAALTFWPAMAWGAPVATAEAFGARALAHYARPVRANRRRLARRR
jgi:hypothetical protein